MFLDWSLSGFWVFSQSTALWEGKTKWASWDTEKCFLEVLQESLWVRYASGVTAGICVCGGGCFHSKT